MFSRVNFTSAVALVVIGGPLLVIPVAAQTTQPAPNSKGVATAPVDAEPQTTTASFGDWVKRCQRVTVGGAPQRLCEVAQTVQVQGQPGPIAELAIGRVKKEDPLSVTLVLPVNVGFPSAPKVALDGKPADSAELAWRRCLQGGCYADAPIKDDLLRLWRASDAAGRIEARDAVGRPIAVSISFRGLAQALDALAKE
jgi:invasion protein IalB